jgi:hypothetical protein
LQQFVPFTHWAINPSGLINPFLKPSSASWDSGLHVQALDEVMNTEIRIRGCVLVKTFPIPEA